MKNAGLWALLLCFAFVAAPAGAGKKAEAAPEPFFGPDKLYTIHLHVSEAAWQLMQPTRRARPAPLIADSIPAPANVKKDATTQATVMSTREAKHVAVDGEKLEPNNFGFEYVYVKARFECDGEALGEVGLRFKGNSSFENYQRGIKRPFKVDFDRFVHGQRFHGLATLNLGNNAFDGWQLREALSFEVYRRAGVPAPRTAFAMVYLTVDGHYQRQLAGFYTLVEELDDKSFLKEHFTDAGGLLMKPEGIRGLPYMGENWAAYPQRYHTKTREVDAESSRRFIDFIKLVNYADDATFKAKIDDYLAVDPFLRYLAATVLITNLDSPLVTNHNFYLYENPKDRKVWMMPWDMNLSFASYGGAGTGETFNLSISHPWAGENKLFTRVMGIAENDRAYREHLRAFVSDFFNEAGMQALAKPMQAALANAEAMAAAEKQPAISNAGEAGGRFGRLGYTLAEYVPKRVESIMAQLDGRRAAGFVPRPNGLAMGMRWGVKAPSDYGNLSAMAQAIRRFADNDSDYKLSGREARDAVAALFYNGVSEAQPESMDLRELTATLTPLVKEFVPQASPGLFGINWHGSSTSAGIWATAIFRDADTDRDGKVTLAELTDLAARLTCLADRDQDGGLDEREIIEGLDMLAAPDGGGVMENAPIRGK
jgi:spore coat protein H